jgi:hypothetical protein
MIDATGTTILARIRRRTASPGPSEHTSDPALPELARNASRQHFNTERRNLWPGSGFAGRDDVRDHGRPGRPDKDTASTPACYDRRPMRTMLLLAFALSSLATLGCGVSCGDFISVETGSAFISMHLLPESAATAPETVVVSSPFHAFATIPPVGPDAGVWTNVVFAGNSLSFPITSGSISQEASGDRLMGIRWDFEDGDASAPPSDQFDVTVTDAAGKITGQFAQTGHYTWTPRMTCEEFGHWNGPSLSDDGGMD